VNTAHLNTFHRLESALARPHCIEKRPFKLLAFLRQRGLTRARLRSETGAATAEYAITTLAAVGFAGLLVVVLRSGEVRGMLTDIIRSALSLPV